MKKRILFCAILIILATVVLLFCGCENSDTSNNSKNEQNENLSNSNTSTTPNEDDSSNANVTKYTVCFDSGGGTEIESQTIEQNSKVVKPTDPIKTGYVFDGWHCNGEKWSFVGYVVTENITLIAKWITIDYEISYDLNGGTLTNEKSSFTVESETFEIEEPKKTGYSFIGWSGTGLLDLSKTITVSKGSTGSKHYVANWKANGYTVTLDANEGELLSNTVLVTYDEYIEYPIPNRKGYKFAGWLCNEFLITDNLGKAYTKCSLLNDSVFTAKWIPIEYSITYDLDGGMLSNTIDSFTIESETIIIDEPRKNGYVFLGWTGTDLSDYTETIIIAKGSVGEKSYSANWKPIESTIVFDADGGQIDVGYIVAKYNEYIVLPVPTKEGYDFYGWFKDECIYQSGVWLYKEGVHLKAKWIPKTDTQYVVNHYQQNPNDDEYVLSNSQTYYGTTASTVVPKTNSYYGFITPTEKEIIISGDGKTVLNYYYDRVKFEISFITNGGETLDAQSIKYMQTLNQLPVPNKNGNTFGGWFLDEKQTIEAEGQIISNRITLYAWWKEEEKASHFQYRKHADENSKIEIYGYSGDETEVAIPSHIGGMPVIKIAAHTFKNSKIESVIIPSTIKTIGEWAFYGCGSLISITIPHTIENLGNLAFAYCDNLSTVVVGNGITTIPESCFSHCEKLIEVTLGAEVSVIGARAFAGCSSLNRINAPSLEKWIEIDWVPDMSYHFSNRYDLYCDGELIEHLVVPLEVTKIKKYAFSFCKSLKTVVINDKVTEIDNYAFIACDNLYRITMTNTVVRIGQAAFYINLDFLEIVFDGTIQQWQNLLSNSSVEWQLDIEDYLVSCEDGTISKNGTIIKK